jgi:hypothetical protein
MSAIGYMAEQQPTADETTRGISIQQQGKTQEALASLRAAVKRNKGFAGLASPCVGV